MTVRWSNPSGSLGLQRFHIWPAGTDSYSHTDLAASQDKLDGMIGVPASGDAWPPTEGIDGGIYKLILDINATLVDLQDQIDLIWIEINKIKSKPDPEPYPPLVVTSLPSSPHDAQEIYYLPDSSGHVQWKWHLRYNASSASPYKWEWLGGSSIKVTSTGTHVRSSLGWGQPDSGGSLPTFNTPLVGEYVVEWGGFMHMAHKQNSVKGFRILVDGVVVATWQNTHDDAEQNLGSVVSTVAQPNRGIKLEMYKSDLDVTLERAYLRVRPERVG